MSWRCGLAGRIVERGFAKRRVAPWLQYFVWREVSRCERCRVTYDRLARGERLLASGGQDPDTPSALELELFAARVVRAPHAAARESRRIYYGFAAASALAAALIAIVVGRPPQIDEFQARGGAHGAVAHIRFLCQQTDAAGRVSTQALSGADGLACPSGASLAFAYTAERDGFVSLHWRGQRGAGWLLRNTRVSAASRPAALDTELRLDVAGPLTISTMVSPTPLSADALETLLQGSASADNEVTLRQQAIEVSP